MITGNASYLPTIDQFIPHWSAVNTILTPVSLVLAGARSLATLTALRASLAAARTDVEVKRNGHELARAVVGIRRRALLGRMQQVMDAVRAFWDSTGHPGTLPNKPSETADGSDIESALDDVADVWLLVNGAAAPAGVILPLTLMTDPTDAVPSPPAYTQALFVADIALLKTAHTAVPGALMALNAARATRNAIQDKIRPILVDYREAMPTKLAPGHALQTTLPRYSPNTGSTPDGAEAVGLWDAPLVKAVLTFNPSTSASVVRHELRYVAGADYDAEDENVVASINVGDLSRFETLAGLLSPGVTASYRIYAITEDGHERMSNTVTITRPE